MKRILKLIIISAVFLICFSYNFSFSAEEYIVENDLGVNFNEFVPEKMQGEFVFTEEDDISSKVNKAASVLSIENILNSVKNAFMDSFGYAIKSFSAVFGLIIISSVMGIYKSSFGDKFRICESVSVLAFSALSFMIFTRLFDSTQYYAQRLCLVAQSLFATMCGLSFMGGELIGAGITDGTVMLIISIIQGVSVNILLPVIKICLVLSICSSLCTSLNLKGLVSPVKTVCGFGLGAMTTLFSAVLFFQKSITISGDSLNLRLSKFALSSLIPVVGSMVGESLRTVLGSVSIVKNITGILGISCLVYLVIPPVCNILVYKICLLICGFVSKIMGLSKQSEMLYDINGVLNVMNSLLICVSLTFIISCGIMMLSLNV